MSPWDPDYFAEDYWVLAAEHLEGSIAPDVEFLGRVFEAAPGRRVADMECGPGDGAVGLAARGFTVTALEASHSAIERGRCLAAQAGVRVRWQAVDLFAQEAWPLEEVEGAICRWYWRRPDGEHRRLLRRLRRHLAGPGVLVLRYAVPFWFGERVLVAGDGDSDRARRFHIGTDFDPVSGTVTASVRVTAGDRADRSFRLGARLYSPPELASVVREAGFAIEQLTVAESDTSSAMSGPVTIVARPLASPPRALAVASWATPPGVRLDLRYASDEADLLDPSPAAVWEDTVLSEARAGADVVASYAVDDPYGGRRAAQVVSRHFGCPLDSHQVTVGAGVTSLLHALSGLADGGLIAAPELVHADLEAWGVPQGVRVQLLTAPDPGEVPAGAIGSVRPALLHLDRPSFTCRVMSLTDLEAMVRVASRAGALTVIDEAGATYLGPEASAVTLINRVDSLVVLRGFTKAYSWGGLRLGFAVASPHISDRVRELVPPMQFGELALRAGVRLLAAGDVCARLRARVREVKPVVVAALLQAGFTVYDGHPDLPRVALADHGGQASLVLERKGIRGLRPSPVPVVPRPSAEVVQISLPLSRERVRLLRELLADESGDRGSTPYGTARRSGALLDGAR